MPTDEPVVKVVIDLSAYQWKLPLEKLQDAGVDHLILRCGRGITEADSLFLWYLRNAYQLNFQRVDNYHVYYPWLSSTQQADAWHTLLADDFDFARGESWGDFEVADKRYPPRAYSTGAHHYLVEFENISLHKPGVYTSKGKWDALAGYTAWLTSYELWAADFTRTPPRLPSSAKTYRLHQFTKSLTIPGILPRMDASRYAPAAPG